MTKKEIIEAKDSKLVYEYATNYALLLMNYNLGKGTKQLQAYCNNLERELLKRGLLTDEYVEKLNS